MGTPEENRSGWQREEKARRAKNAANDAENPRTDLTNCLHCKQPLRRYSIRRIDNRRQFGDYGDNRFCGLRCGYNWAMARTNDTYGDLWQNRQVRKENDGKR